MLDGSKKTGILGGTFNPIHIGHLIIAETVRELYDLEKVLFVPSGSPPHKRDIDVAEAEKRYDMVRLAVESNPFFEASRVETDRSGYTYTVDTLLSLKRDYSRLLFMTGADVIPEITTWKNFKKVFELCEFIAVLRPGYGEDVFNRDIAGLRESYGAVINTVSVPQIGISSTDIRNRVKEGRTIRYMVPGSVEKYIYDNRLYK